MADRPNGEQSSREELSTRTVLVCGARFAGSAAARGLLDAGARVLLTDSQQTETLPALLAAGAQFRAGLDQLPDGIDLVVASPGWRPDHPIFVSAQANGIDVIGEVELAWRLRPEHAAPWLAITGTNGKTTTVRMLEAILCAAGKRALAVGNVGVSIIDAVAAGRGTGTAYDVLAVELSSFQLHWPSTFRPAAAALLNIAPDHLAWHSSMSDYARTKARIWHTPTAVANYDDDLVMQLLQDAMNGAGDFPAPAVAVGFTLDAPVSGQFGVDDGWLLDRAFGDAVPLLPADDIRPRGRHNIANALAASALARAYGVDANEIAAGLRAFVPDPHRNQFIATIDEVDYVDDSKATNPHAASASLLSYQSIVWIAGGQLKGAPVEDLVASVAKRLAAVVLLGQDRAELKAALARHAPDLPVIEVALTDDRAMSEVVRTAAVLACPGDTVLLAPAAASYDMFTGYAERGAAFVAAVSALTGIRP
jgi:UDP-N-acetylmuramoylalanine--D-glutamate ligase